MANQRAWWTLVISSEPNGPHDRTIELSPADRQYIAALIADDYTEGEVVADPPDDHELVWHSVSTGGPGEQRADSRRVAPGAAYAAYSLCPPIGGDPEWDLELLQIKRVPTDDEVIDEVDLGGHPDEDAAKAYALHWERYGTHPDDSDVSP